MTASQTVPPLDAATGIVGETYALESGNLVVLESRDKEGAKLRSAKFNHVVRVPLDIELWPPPADAVVTPPPIERRKATASTEQISEVMLRLVGDTAVAAIDLLGKVCAEFPGVKEVDVRARMILGSLIRSQVLRRDGDSIRRSDVP